MRDTEQPILTVDDLYACLDARDAGQPIPEGVPVELHDGMLFVCGTLRSGTVTRYLPFVEMSVTGVCFEGVKFYECCISAERSAFEDCTFVGDGYGGRVWELKDGCRLLRCVAEVGEMHIAGDDIEIRDCELAPYMLITPKEDGGDPTRKHLRVENTTIADCEVTCRAAESVIQNVRFSGCELDLAVRYDTTTVSAVHAENCEVWTMDLGSGREPLWGEGNAQRVSGGRDAVPIEPSRLADDTYLGYSAQSGTVIND